MYLKYGHLIRGLALPILAIASLAVGTSAEAQTMRIACSSEDEGSLVTKVRPDQFVYYPEQRMAALNNVTVGTLRNGELQVRVNGEFRGSGGYVRLDPLEILFIPSDPTLTVGARIAKLTQRNGTFFVTAVGAGVDPEGIDCTIKIAMPR